MPRPPADASSTMSTPLANSALPSARKSILPSPPVASAHFFMTKASLTAVTATVSTPFFLKASMLLRKLGMCRLVQVGVKAPGTANSATFLPLNTSSVVFGLGPSDVITRKVALGSLSPTLMGMGSSLWLRAFLRSGYLRFRAHLVEAGRDFVGLLAFDHGEGQVERALVRVDARRQPIELEAEMTVAGRCALRRLRNGQGPVRGRAFNEYRDRRVGRRRQVDHHQRLGAAGHALGGQSGGGIGY